MIDIRVNTNGGRSEYISIITDGKWFFVVGEWAGGRGVQRVPFPTYQSARNYVTALLSERFEMADPRQGQVSEVEK